MYETSEDRTRALLDSYIGELIAQDPSFKIGPRNPFRGMSPQDLQRGKDFDYQPDELQKYYDRINRPGPKLPLAYLRDDPALTPMEMSERDFIEYEKNRPMPGTVVDPQKLDLMEYMRNETEGPMVSVHLDLPMKIDSVWHNNIRVTYNQIKGLRK